MSRARPYVVPVALTLVAAIVAVFAWRDRGSVTDRERGEREGRVFPAFRRADLEEIVVVARGERVVLERQRGPEASVDPWRLTSPRGEAADLPAVERLIRELDQARRLRAVEDLAPCGFDAPRARGTLRMGSLSYAWTLGGDARAPEGAAYLRVDGVGAFVVERSVAEELARGADAYRERTLVPYSQASLRAVELRSAEGEATLARMNAADYRIEELGLRASSARVEAVFAALGELRAESFLTDADADRALGGDAVRVSLVPDAAGAPRAEIVLGAACPGHPEGVVAIVRHGARRVSACVPKGAAPPLRVSAPALVDARVFASREGEVAELRLVASPSGRSLDLARRESGWHQRAPVERELAGAQADAANAFVRALVAVEGDGVKRDDGGAFTPRAKVTVVRPGARGEEAVEIGEADAQGAVDVRRSADGARLRVPRAAARLLFPRAVALRPPGVFPDPLPTLPARGLKVACGDVRQELAHDGAGWTILSPRGDRVPADTAAAFELAEAAFRLAAVEWVADEDDGTFGLGASTCSVTLRAESGGRAIEERLSFGADEPRGAYARRDAERAVFVAPKALRSMLGGWLADRAPFAIYLHAASSVTLSASGQRARFAVDRGAIVGPDGGRLALLEEILSGLRPGLALHLGAPLPREGFDRPALTIEVAYAADAGLKATRVVVGAKVETADGAAASFARADGAEGTFPLSEKTVTALLAFVR